ncbi:MAG: class I SAM-dependent methyltransferase [Candidatus Omnitrophica bacterium]|nr:class I SAM-dependent methyltransferase [Candidatus Omnitrophota bacterium]
MKIKRSVKAGMEALFDLAGVKAYFARKRDKSDMVFFDRNMLSSFYNNNGRVRLYYDGLKRTKGEWTDNFSKQCRFYGLQEMAGWVLGKELGGDFAECGCWRGHSTYIISKILSDNNFRASFHVFDSFENGLSDKTPEDENERFALSAKEVAQEKMMFGSTEDEVRKVLSDFKFVKLYKGWIPERFKEVEGHAFSFVHIDVDLYQPTLDSLRFFFPRIVAGGCIVVDDYGFTKFPGSKKAVDTFLSENKCYLCYELPMGGCFIIK